MEKPNMRIGKKILTVFLLIFIAALWNIPVSVHAQDATAYTYTTSNNGRWVRTQDAYLTGGTLFRDAGLKNPQDIFIRDNQIYIADTGNSRIVMMNIDSKKISYIGQDVLNYPTGVYVDNENRILVADYGLQKVVLLSSDGKVIREYGRPTSALFGRATTYKPLKAVSDNGGYIYIVSEGSYDGIIQLSQEGDFLGYFGANQTAVSPIQAIENLFFTKEQKAKLFHIVPRPFKNIALDSQGMIYSITQSEKGDAIKKHSVSGNNILVQSEAGKMIDENNFVDLTVDQNGDIFAVNQTGLIYEYDSSGSLIFSFGGRAISTERSGLFTLPSGIAADNNGNIYILDSQRNMVQVFFPTSFAQDTSKAISLFQSGQYSRSKDLWEKLLTISDTSRIAHNGMGNAYFQADDYKDAAQQFKITKNQTDYSQAYWEIRNDWLQANTGWIIILIMVIILINKGLRLADKKRNIFGPFRKISKRIMKNKVIRDVFYLKSFIRHPIDSFYYLRKNEKGSVLGATIIYFIAFIVFTSNYLFREFIFSTVDASDVSYSYILVLFFMPVVLWVAGNYMVSTINEGEGRIRDVYCAAAYSFAPFILFMPFVIILTYVLTLNEAFIINFSSLIIWVWCGVILFLGIKEIHNYEIREVIKNILLTLFFMFIAILAFSIIYMLWDQGIQFVYSIIKEVAYRVH